MPANTIDHQQVGIKSCFLAASFLNYSSYRSFAVHCDPCGLLLCALCDENTVLPSPLGRASPPRLSAFQYLGKWFFKAAVSRHEAQIAKFQPLDSLWFNMEKRGNDTLLLTGHTHV